MKYIFSIIASLILLTAFTIVQVQAQEEDEGVVFEVETTFAGDQSVVNEVKSLDFQIQDPQNRGLRIPPVTMVRKLKLPKSVKILPSPNTLKHNGNCYIFGCQKENGCQECRMLWWDRNGDGKVQPQRELRCVCPDGGKCRIRVEKVKC